MENERRVIEDVEYRSLSIEAPLPPAAEFERYERAFPGTASKILDMAEVESTHRRENETKLIDEAIRRGRYGQYFAFVIVMLSLVIIFISVIVNRPIASSIIPAIVACTGIAAVFIDRKK